ncbi:flagellar motor protein PomA [bacterium SCSIO 12696]|nr:flagellar motor protein PomA [bacterium SCSIO 12696]
MDLATLLGLLGATATIIAAMLAGEDADIMAFVDVASILIVVVGTILVVLMKFNLKEYLMAFKVAMRAFIFKLEKPEELIPQIVELAKVARKEGLIALDGQEISNKFLDDGIKMLVDGHDAALVKTVMLKEMQQTIDRHTWGAKVFIATADVAPAMGMIGTLIGLVKMLGNMDDPKSIGPAMAVALLTTLYGAMIANMFASPIADKLTLRKTEEGRIMAMCIDGVMGIQEGQNPRVIESTLKAYLDPAKREIEAEESAA